MPSTRSGVLTRFLTVGLLLIAAPPASAQLFDFDNVVLLSRMATYAAYNDVWGFVGNDGREYVIQGTTTGTAWWDVEDPANPVEVKFLFGPMSTWRDMFVIDDHAYIGTEGGGGLQIVDLSDPSDPTLVGSYTATVNACHNIFGDVDRKLVYVVGGSGVGGLQILDASNPTNLVQVGAWQVDYLHDVSAYGTLVYGSAYYASKVRVIDTSDPGNPVSVGPGFPDLSAHASWPFAGGNFVASAAERQGGYLKILDVTDPQNVGLVDIANPDPSTSVHNVHVEGDRLYASWYTRGTRIYDVSDPHDIAEIGYFDTFPGAGSLFSGNWGVYPHLPSGLVVASDRTYGMFLMEYAPDVATLEGTVSSSAGGVLGGAHMTLLGTKQSHDTDAAGAYRLSARPGSWNIEASMFGHETKVVGVAAGAATTVTTDLVLTKHPAGELSGVVTDTESGLALEGVELALQTTPLTASTDASGAYVFPDVPTVPSASYTLSVHLPGYEVPEVLLTIVADDVTTRDLELRAAETYVDFSDPSGWSVTNDGATDGFWVFGEPRGTFSMGIPVQPETDHTFDPEDQCAVTGNSAGAPNADDVDGGATRLLSPTYDLSAMTAPHVFYYRWYATHGGYDEWQTHVTTDAGDSWILLESTPDNEAFWQPIDIDLTPITGSAPQVRFRFTCEDPNPGQLVEGALDDFSLYDAATGAVGVAIPEKTIALRLAQNLPNPFGASTNIGFSLPAREHTLLSVFDVRGRRIATLVDSELSAGVHEASWDARMKDGQRAAAGIYFYELRTQSEVRTRKMIYLP